MKLRQSLFRFCREASGRVASPHVARELRQQFFFFAAAPARSKSPPTARPGSVKKRLAARWRKEEKKWEGYGTPGSSAITDRRTNEACGRLTSQIGRDVCTRPSMVVPGDAPRDVQPFARRRQAKTDAAGDDENRTEGGGELRQPYLINLFSSLTPKRMENEAPQSLFRDFAAKPRTRRFPTCGAGTASAIFLFCWAPAPLEKPTHRPPRLGEKATGGARWRKEEKKWEGYGTPGSSAITDRRTNEACDRLNFTNRTGCGALGQVWFVPGDAHAMCNRSPRRHRQNTTPREMMKIGRRGGGIKAALSHNLFLLTDSKNAWKMKLRSPFPDFAAKPRTPSLPHMWRGNCRQQFFFLLRRPRARKAHPPPAPAREKATAARVAEGKKKSGKGTAPRVPAPSLIGRTNEACDRLTSQIDGMWCTRPSMVVPGDAPRDVQPFARRRQAKHRRRGR
ncbi:hypothetical protein TcBrA4_0090870 [Trypanosoma cruzi]|nr:hypothetical protein TcBrA4_0090870 [Trypanosoma cruzi]